MPRPSVLLGAAAVCTLFVSTYSIASAETSGTEKVQTAVKDVVDTSTDFLSDDAWRRLPREKRHERVMRNALARYEPSGVIDSSRLQDYVNKFKQFNIYDPRLFIYKVNAQLVEGTTDSVKLSGEVSVARYAAGTQTVLSNLGFKVVENNIATLPAPELGSDIYAVSTTFTATMRREPRDRAEQVNSVPMGGCVRLLREARESDMATGAEKLEGKWYLGQTLEGYTGFMRDDELLRQKEIRTADAMVLQPTTVTIRGKQVVLPVGSYVYSAGSRYKVFHADDLLPAKLKVKKVNSPAFTEAEIMKIIQPVLGTKYVWGGVTNLGIDCSGLTQLLMKTRGVAIPRDAEEQATLGNIVAFGPEAEKLAKPGDIIFFVGESGRISHVGISLGNGKLLHSSNRPGVAVQPLREHDDDSESSLADRIIFARRMISQ